MSFEINFWMTSYHWHFYATISFYSSADIVNIYDQLKPANANVLHSSYQIKYSNQCALECDEYRNTSEKTFLKVPAPHRWQHDAASLVHRWAFSSSFFNCVFIYYFRCVITFFTYPWRALWPLNLLSLSWSFCSFLQRLFSCPGSRVQVHCLH